MFQTQKNRLIGLIVLATFAAATAPAAQAQEIPPEVQRELDRRGLTPEQAREQARRLGIDLSNPDQALRRARELGIPESTIQTLLRAVEEAETPSAQGLEAARGMDDFQPPVLEGLPTLAPTTLRLTQELAPVKVRVALRDELSGVQSVEFLLVRISSADPPQQPSDGQVRRDTLLSRRMQEVLVRGDTLRADQVRHIQGNTFRGTWEGTFYISAETPAAPWELLVRATDVDGNTGTIETQASLRILEAEDPTAGIKDSLVHFGYDVFQNVPDAFRPGSNNVAGSGYVVGPGDELRLTVWGGAEFQHDLMVDPEGRIYIPKVGQLTVAGRRLDDLRSDMRIWLSRSYAGLVDEPPSVFMDVSVTRLKPLHVFVLGEVPQPGGYTVSAGSSIFNVLYSVGGPETSGSLRDVRIVRGDGVASADLYDFLLKGRSSGGVNLQSGDHVFIPPRGKTVTIKGAVKRPAIYELTPEESFVDLVSFAGGLKAEAYTKRFHVERIIPFAERTDPTIARTVLDLDLRAVLSGDRPVALQDGDVVTIVAIAEEANLAGRSRIPAAEIAGAVFKPGQFEIGSNLRTVRDLIEAADGLTGNAYRQKADLVRLNSNLEREIVGLNLSRVIDDAPTQNLVLRPQDSLYVYSMPELEAKRTVSISGQVRTPGEYPLLEGMTVSDLLFRGGGLRDSVYLKDVLLERADLVRRSVDGRTDEIIPFDLEAALRGVGMSDVVLRPEDEIVIYEGAVVEPVRQDERFVVIDGSVKDPGRYRYYDGMTLEDLLLRAGGFREDAFLERADVTRPLSTDSRDGQNAMQLQVPLTMSGDLASVGSGIVPDPTNVLAGARRFELRHRDLVFIRRDPVFVEQQTVTLRGEVEFPGEYTLLHENESLASVVARAGGVRPTGYEKGGRLRRNGEQVVLDMERALDGDRRYNVILQAGDEIVMPPQPNTVAVRGNVALEGLVKHVPGKRVSYYLDRAGGVLDDTEAVYVTQASGARYRVRQNHILSRSPIVDDGASIVVTLEPPKDPEERLDYGELITNTMAILSSALTIMVLGRRALD